MASLTSLTCARLYGKSKPHLAKIALRLVYLLAFFLGPQGVRLEVPWQECVMTILSPTANRSARRRYNFIMQWKTISLDSVMTPEFEGRSTRPLDVNKATGYLSTTTKDMKFDIFHLHILADINHSRGFNFETMKYKADLEVPLMTISRRVSLRCGYQSRFCFGISFLGVY